MSVEVILATATPTPVIPCEHGLSPVPISPLTPLEVVGTAIYIVRVAFTFVLLRDYSALCATTFSGGRAGWTVPVSVLVCKECGRTDLTGLWLGVRGRKLPIDLEKYVLVLSNSPGVLAVKASGL